MMHSVSASFFPHLGLCLAGRKMNLVYSTVLQHKNKTRRGDGLFGVATDPRLWKVLAALFRLAEICQCP